MDRALCRFARHPAQIDKISGGITKRQTARIPIVVSVSALIRTWAKMTPTKTQMQPRLIDTHRPYLWASSLDPAIAISPGVSFRNNLSWLVSMKPDFPQSCLW